MCGRYTLRTPLQHVLELFGASIDQEKFSFAARFNIAPMQDVPAIRVDPQGKTTLSIMRWGLVPAWATDPAVGNRMINARSETVAERPAFREAFRRRRCVVPADGFYEWKTSGGKKQPYFIRRPDDLPFGLASLWERWRRGDQTVESFTILTTWPNSLARDIHNRMPVILSSEGARAWLDRKTPPEKLASLLVPCADDLLTASPVNPIVNSPRNDCPECIAPASPVQSTGTAQPGSAADAEPSLFSEISD